MMVSPPDARQTVIYIGGFELPDGNAAAQRVVANAEALEHLGYRVVLLGVRRRGGAVGAIERVSYPDIAFECWETALPVSKRQWLEYITSAKALKTLLDQLGDVPLKAVIAYNHPAIAQMGVARLARKRGAALIADVTEWYAHVRGGGIAGAIKNLDVPLRMRWANRRADGIISISPFLTEFYRRPGTPVVEIPTLMPTAAAAAPRAARSDAAATKRLFFAGSGFDPAVVRRTGGLKDRLDVAIELLAAASESGCDFHLDIFGVDRNAYLEIRPDHAALLERLAGQATFHGRKPRELVIDRLAECDFSIFFRDVSRVTLAGFPTKYAESIHYGTPVITNTMPNLTPYHREGKTGFMVDGTSAARREAIVRILELPAAEIAAMKHFCASSQLFSYRSFSRKFAQFMTELPRG